MAKNKKIAKTVYLDEEIAPIFDLLSNRNYFITMALKHFAYSENADWIFKDVEEVRMLLENKSGKKEQKENNDSKDIPIKKNNEKVEQISQTKEGFDIVD